MKIREKLSYANVMATIAVFLALGGGVAMAAGGFTGKQKKQVGTIATKVFESKIAGASVLHADKATTATAAATATTAADSQRLGGRSPDEYQRPLNGACAPPLAIADVDKDGNVTCTTPVKAISLTPGAAGSDTEDLGDGLRLVATCHVGEVVEVLVQNVGGSQAGLLGWMEGSGGGGKGSIVVSGSMELPSGTGQKGFSFKEIQIELHLFYSIGNSVMTTDVIARDNTGQCPVRGTEVTAGS